MRLRSPHARPFSPTAQLAPAARVEIPPPSLREARGNVVRYVAWLSSVSSAIAAAMRTKRVAAVVALDDEAQPRLARADKSDVPFSRDVLMRALAIVREGAAPAYLDEPPCEPCIAVASLGLSGAVGFVVVECRPHRRDVLGRLDAAARTASSMLEDARERIQSEHRRLERVLHDTFATTLTNLTFASGRLAALPGTPGDGALRSVRSYAMLAIRQFRDILDVVAGRVPQLPKPDLEAVVAEFRGYGVPLRVRGVLDMDDLSVEQAAGLCEVVREALTNVMRHAKADRVDVEITRTSDALIVRIADDGIGLLGEGQRSVWSGVGLRLMRERVRELGGILQVRAPASGGTRIVANLPLR